MGLQERWSFSSFSFNRIGQCTCLAVRGTLSCMVLLCPTGRKPQGDVLSTAFSKGRVQRACLPYKHKACLGRAWDVSVRSAFRKSKKVSLSLFFTLSLSLPRHTTVRAVSTAGYGAACNGCLFAYTTFTSGAIAFLDSAWIARTYALCGMPCVWPALGTADFSHYVCALIFRHWFTKRISSIQGSTPSLHRSLHVIREP